MAYDGMVRSKEKRAVANRRYVYCIEGVRTRRVKIGVATDAFSRLGTLQVGCSERLRLVGVLCTDDPHRFEAAYHQRFRHLALHGEWFSPHPELWEFMDDVLTPPDEIRDNMPMIIMNPTADDLKGVSVRGQPGESYESFMKRVLDALIPLKHQPPEGRTLND